MNIGQAIKAARKKAGLTQIELAEQINIAQTSLSQIEVGAVKPSAKTVQAICEALHISEALLYILSIDENDVPKGREDIYEMLFPTVRDMAMRILDKSQDKK